jgi:hypothetical protein
MRRAVAALVLLVLAGCGSDRIDRQQAAEERRVCASLIERVVGRALDDSGPLDLDPKPGPLDPDTLDEDPEAFYEALDERLAEAGFGPDDERSSISPATEVVARCRAASR